MQIDLHLIFESHVSMNYVSHGWGVNNIPPTQTLEHVYGENTYAYLCSIICLSGYTL